MIQSCGTLIHVCKIYSAVKRFYCLELWLQWYQSTEEEEEETCINGIDSSFNAIIEFIMMNHTTVRYCNLYPISSVEHGLCIMVSASRVDCRMMLVLYRSVFWGGSSVDFVKTTPFLDWVLTFAPFLSRLLLCLIWYDDNDQWLNYH